MSPTLSRPTLGNSTNTIANPLLKKLSLKKPLGAVSAITTNSDPAEVEKTEIKNTEPEIASESVIAEAPAQNPFKKPLSFDKFREANKTEKPVVETKVENVTTATAEAEVVEVENTAEVTTKEANEVSAAEEIVVAETAAEEAETAEEVKAEEVTEEIEQPKKKRTRRSKAQIEADALNASENEKTETITCDSVSETSEVRNNSTVSFSEAVNAFRSFSADAEWVEYKNDIEKAYEAINITPDINSAMLVGIINQLSNLRDRIWNQHQYYKNQFDQLSSKEPEGVIERIKRINVNETANNDMARKKSGIAACMNYKTENGDTINLYDLLDEVRARYYFLNAIMSNIEFKKNLLITISSALKIENGLS